jgi:acetyltransferase-like isoleucine patch superfamily enzyme
MKILKWIKKLLGSRRIPRSDKDRVIVINGIDVDVGRYTYGLESATVLAWGESKVSVKIGRYCSISYGLQIVTGGNHRTDWTTTYPFGHLLPSSKYMPPIVGHPLPSKPIEIRNDVWIGRGVYIMPGVVVGNGAVIATNSHVVKDVPDYAIVGGNPAKVIGFRFDHDTIDRLLTEKWWDWDDEKIYANIGYLCSPAIIN